MSAAHELFARASQWLWPALANHLWQATLLAALILGATLLLRRAPARVRHALWLVASAKLLLPSALFALLAELAHLEPAWLHGAAKGASGGATPLVLQFAEPMQTAADNLVVTAAATRHSELFCALTLVWLAGVAALLAVWISRRRGFLRAVREGREVFAGREFDALERARARLGLKRDVLLAFARHEVEPCVWRTRRPVVVLPETVAEHLDDEELEALMLHELAHAERRDNFYASMQTALACVFWFCPVVWLVNRRTLAERERACDERVLEAGGAANAYASSILKVVRFCFGWRMAGVSGAAAGSNLRRRIEMILHDNTRRKFSTLHRALLCVAAVGALAFSVMAGLLGSARGGDAIAQQRRGADASVRAGDTRGGAARRGEAGPAVKEIMSAPDSVVYFEQTQGAPLTIMDARMRLITREQLTRADNEGADSFDEEERSETFATLPTITLANASGKAVMEAGISFSAGGQTRVIMGFAAAIRPGDTQIFDSEWRGRNVIIAGHPSDFTVRLVWATFADGTRWGARALAPRPVELPPPPGRVSGAGSATAGADEASGLSREYWVSSGSGGGSVVVGGSADGVGRGSGGGVGSGSGDGIGKGVGGGVGGSVGGSVGGGMSEGVGAGVGGGKRGSRGGGLRDQALSLPNPSYPPLAKAARAQGSVGVKIIVDEDGNVVSAEAVSGHPLLRSAAVEAVRKAKFKPAVVEGQPVKVAGVITYNFVLSDDNKDNEQED